MAQYELVDRVLESFERGLNPGIDPEAAAKVVMSAEAVKNCTSGVEFHMEFPYMTDTSKCVDCMTHYHDLSRDTNPESHASNCPLIQSLVGSLANVGLKLIAADQERD